MSSPSAPATLTPAQARDLIQEIRVQGRPQLLAELRRLYHAADGSTLSRAEILAGELRLQALDQSLMSLLPVVVRADGSLGWEFFRPPLRAFRRHGSTAVEAEVEMAFSPENHECVHGPSTLVPVVTLARRLLAAGERLTTVERVTWAVPLRHRVRLSVWDPAAATAPAAEGAFSGRLRTSVGRALEFVAVPLSERPLRIQRDYNDLSRGLVKGQRLVLGPEADTATMALAEEGLAACRRAVRHRPALCTALVFDLVPMAILNWKRGRPMVACGYRDVPLPSAAAAFAPGTRLELRYRGDDSHTSNRSGLWIGYYDFRYLPRQTEWSTMVMAEAGNIETLLRKVHS